MDFGENHLKTKKKMNVSMIDHEETIAVFQDD
jgi:hypothetical protein